MGLILFSRQPTGVISDVNEWGFLWAVTVQSKGMPGAKMKVSLEKESVYQRWTKPRIHRSGQELFALLAQEQFPPRSQPAHAPV